MLLKAKHIVLKDGFLLDGAIEIENGIITKILANDEIPSDVESIDYGDAYISPGLVDTHVHGYAGHDIMDLDSEGFRYICEKVVETGVTSFLPTTLTASIDDTDKAVKIINENRDAKGAKIRGIFLEGPFFTSEHSGAQNPRYFIDPSILLLNKWQESAGGLIKKIAVAPELYGTKDFVKEAKNMGVHVALGHSNATYDQAKEAVEAGADIFVHVYNAMSKLHHREPGMVGAALSLDDTYGELICDGHHVHPAAAKIAIRAKGPKNIALITDCMMAGGMPDGDYRLGSFDVEVSNGTARLKNDGNLAGSILNLSRGIRNVVEWDVADVFEAIHMATYVPAKSVGIDDVCGLIEVDREADLAIFDKDLELSAVYLDGELVFERK